MNRHLQVKISDTITYHCHTVALSVCGEVEEEEEEEVVESEMILLVCVITSPVWMRDNMRVMGYVAEFSG